MSEYHNQAAFDARLVARRANPIPPLPLKVFYHISCMGNWQEVVTEQLRLLAFVRLREAHSCILGSEDDAQWCCEKADEIGVDLNIGIVNADLKLYEAPTLNWLHEWACANHAASVLYFHTKGVSKPVDKHKTAWRRLMQKHVIADWRANLDKLAIADILGVSWQELRDFPHFQGNFWMARCDWIAHLQPLSEYRHRHPPFRWGGHSWTKRMFVETWIGSERWHHVESLLCRNGCFWEGPQVFHYDINIPGFSYGDKG